MVFQDDSRGIVWRVHLKSPPEAVYEMLDTSAGRARFWAESAEESDGAIQFVFPSGVTWTAEILERDPPQRLRINYFDDSETTFFLQPAVDGGTELLLVDTGVSGAHRSEVAAGWVSVLMALKAAVDFDVDLRNHDRDRVWSGGYVNN